MTYPFFIKKISFGFSLEVFPNLHCYILTNFILHFESLFTNLPLEETILNCVNFFVFNKSKIDNLIKQDLYDLLSPAAKDRF